MHILVCYSSFKEHHNTLLLQKYKDIFEKDYEIEFIKQVKDITEFFGMIKKNFQSRILKSTQDAILLTFEHAMIMREFVKNVEIFYPNPLDTIFHETQHVMKDEPIYSFFGDHVLIGKLNDDDTIQFGNKSYNQYEFRKLHWGILSKELKCESKRTSFNNCKIKRNGEFINFQC